ncbi:ABC transporter permease [bacterium]|nr:ABC transporter permease [bacterium]
MFLLKTAFQNIAQNKKNFFLSSFGIIIGMAIFVFFIALSSGMQNVVNEKIFDSSIHFIKIKSQTPLTEETIRELKNNELIKNIYPVQNMDMPFMVEGKILGNYFRMDAIGFGLPLEMVEKDLVEGTSFKKGDEKDAVPVVVSQEIFEIYNGSYAISHGLPKLSPALLRNYPFKIILGESFIHNSDKENKRLKAKIVGVSKNVPLGFAVPLDYVKEWREFYLNKEASEKYDQLILESANKTDLAVLKNEISKDSRFMLVTDNNERINFFIMIVTLLFLVISLIIIVISAINIMQTFYASVNTRIKEISVLRAIGATKSYIRKMILLESGIIGFFGGLIGIVIALLLGLIIDWYSNNRLPDFPYKPDTYFSYPLWLLLSAIPFAIFFCLLGAYLPARKAANLDPSFALNMQQ